MRSSILLALFLLACGSDSKGSGSSDDCTHPLVGTWDGVTQNDEIRISPDGTFAYSGPDGCVSSGTYSCPVDTATRGSLQVTVGSASAGLCLPAGNYSCAFDINGNGMAYDCVGTGALQYRRQ